MRDIKILFAGSTGAGKTTAISKLSEMPVSSTVTAVGEETASLAVTLDFGVLMLEDGQQVKFYGLPGHHQLSPMWRRIGANALGAIILIDNASATPLQDLDAYLHTFMSILGHAAIVVGVTHMDKTDCPSLNLYHQFLWEKQLRCPLFAVDPRRVNDVKLLVSSLLAMVETGYGERVNGE